MNPFLFLDISKAQKPPTPAAPKAPAGAGASQAYTPPSPKKLKPGGPGSYKNTTPASVGSGSQAYQVPNMHGKKSDIDWTSYQVWQGTGTPPPGAKYYTKRGGGMGVAVPKGATRGNTPDAAADTGSAESNPMADAQSEGFGQSTPQGGFSMDETHYENTDPLHHYKIAQQHGKTGATELEQWHKNLARKKAEEASPEDHFKIADQLKELGYHEDAAWHEKQGMNAQKRQQADGAAEDPDPADAPAEEDTKQQEAAADTEPPAEEEQQPKEDTKQQEAAAKETNAGKKAREKLRKEDPVAYDKAHKQRLKEHDAKKPSAPPPFQGVPPLKPESDTPAAKAKYKKERRAYDVAKRQHDAAKKKHAKDLHDWKMQRDEIDKDKVDPTEIKEHKKKLADEKKQQEAAEKEKAAAEAKKPRPPQSDLEEAQVADHAAKATELHQNIQSHLDNDDDMDPNVRKKLSQAQKILEKHKTQKTVPTEEEAAELKAITQVAGEQGKKPFEEAEEAEDFSQESSAKPTSSLPSLSSVLNTASSVGGAIGSAAAAPEGGGALGAMAITYAGRGVISGGHSLLSDTPAERKHKEYLDRQEARKQSREAAKAEGGSAPPSNKKGAEQEQSSMGKSFELYLDLAKAVSQIPNVSIATKTEKQNKREFEASYSKQPTGVVNAGPVMEDDPDKGAQWKHDDEDDDEEEKKSLSIAKSLRTMTGSFVRAYKPSDLEQQFMVEVLGYDQKAVRKGLCAIAGKNRHLFNEWMLERMEKSMSGLNRWSE